MPPDFFFGSGFAAWGNQTLDVDFAWIDSYRNTLSGLHKPAMQQAQVTNALSDQSLYCIN